MTIRSAEIAICTWNRAGLLAQTLESIGQLAIPVAVDWRVILVDNGSTDTTRDVVAGFSPGLPLRLVSETRQGHTFARNRAIAESTADLIAWTDDDVLVDPAWLKNLVIAANWNPHTSFFGGPVEPVFPDGRPAWIAENWPTVQGCFAARDLGPHPVKLAADRLSYGANLAVRGDVQRSFLFDTKLGRCGSEVAGEDELDLQRRLLAAGHPGVWVPDARVKHQIPSERASEQYVRDYFVGQGRRLALSGAAWSRHAWKLALIRSWHAWLYRFKRPRSKSAAWLAHLARSGLAEGQLRQLREANPDG